MGRTLSPVNDEVDPALRREWMAKGDERLLSDDEGRPGN